MSHSLEADANYAVMIRSVKPGHLWSLHTDAQGRQSASNSETPPSVDELLQGLMVVPRYVCSRDPVSGAAVHEGPYYRTREEAIAVLQQDGYLDVQHDAAA